MVTLKLSQSTADGTPVGPNIVLTDCELVYGKGWHKARLGQESVTMRSGLVRTFDNGVTVLYGELMFKGMSPENKTSLENFITDILVFNKSFFNVELVGDTETDLGGGPGVPLIACKFGTEFDSLEGKFQFVAPGVYDTLIPYYTRSV